MVPARRPAPGRMSLSKVGLDPQTTRGRGADWRSQPRGRVSMPPGFTLLGLTVEVLPDGHR